MSNCSTGPYLTAGGWTKTLNAPPLRQGQIVGDLRRQHESTRGFNPWSCWCGAIRHDLRDHTGHDQLSAALGRAPNGFASHYRDLAGGWVRYVRSIGGSAGLALAGVRDVTVIRSGLPIKLNPQLGITFPDGHVEVIQLWFDAVPLAEHAAQTLLYLMQINMGTLFAPEATACVLDVRRSVAHHLPRRWRASDVDSYIDAHATRIVSLWQARG